MNTSKPASINFFVIIIILLVGACGTIPPEQGSNETAASAPTFTLIPPTIAQTPTSEFVPIPATIMPTQTLIPMITPDAIQVERWREYQTASAMELVSVRPVETVLCEWEILGRAELELYLWAVCVSSGYRASRPAVIHLDANGAIQNVEVPLRGSAAEADLNRMFPAVVREKILSYDPAGRLQEMFNHIEWRKAHPDEPPLIVLSAVLTATPTP